jgi:hypothetical protein
MYYFLELLSLLILHLAATKAASLTQVANFGNNPGETDMYIYVPDTLATNPAIIVAVSYDDRLY